MDAFLEFLDKPIVVTLLSLTLGGYLLSLLSDRRARKDKIRDKAIELLTEVGSDVNRVTGSLFGYLRSGRVQIPRDSDLNRAMGNLFLKRMSIRVRSQAYLGSEDFSQKYDTLVWQLRRLMDAMGTLAGEDDLDQVVADIRNRKKRLGDAWPLDEEEVRLESREPPFDELLAWTEMIVHRATHLLSTYLKSSLK